MNSRTDHANIINTYIKFLGSGYKLSSFTYRIKLRSGDQRFQLMIGNWSQKRRNWIRDRPHSKSNLLGTWLGIGWSQLFLICRNKHIHLHHSFFDFIVTIFRYIELSLVWMNHQNHGFKWKGCLWRIYNCDQTRECNTKTHTWIYLEIN